MTFWFGLALTLAAALAWSAFDGCRKVLVQHTSPAPLTAGLAWLQAPLFLLWALSAQETRLDPAYLVPGLKVAAMNLVACLAFFSALRSGDLSRTVPLLSLSPVFTALLGSFVLGELPTGAQWAGIALVVCGALALAAPDGGTPAARGWRGPVWMALTALLWAGTTVYDKVCLSHADASIHAGVQTIGLAIALTSWLATRGRAKEVLSVTARPRILIMGVVVSACALGLQLQAVSLIPVSVMECIKRATCMIAALIIGRVAFHEPLDTRKWSSVTAMSVGVWLVVSG